MTNQAAQTMPLPEPVMQGVHPETGEWRYGYTADQMHQYARDYAAALSQTAGVADGWMRDVADAAAALDKRGDRQMAARLMRLHRDMLAAAPAASGVDTSTNEAWAARAQEKIAAMDAGASVSERAREILAQAECGPQNDYGTVHRQIAHRAIEQALTQQRGECAGDPYIPASVLSALRSISSLRLTGMGQAKREALATINEWLASCGCDTTPQPSADAVRELVQRILDWQPLTSINKADRLYQILVAAGLPFERVTDELESLLGRGGK